jgi:hypothetical protein
MAQSYALSVNLIFGSPAQGLPHQIRSILERRPEMKSKLFALSFGFAALILAVQNAHAAPSCGQRADILSQLAERYSETRQSIGIAANNTVVETFASASGSWSIIVTMASGESCLIASGQYFEMRMESLPAQGEPA